MTRHVLIAGGGIAGSAAALALRRAGMAVTVYEARLDAGDYSGAALRLPRNGLDALRAIEAHQAVVAVSAPLPRTELLSGTGRLLGTVALSTGSEQEQPRALTRAQLAGALRAEAVRQGARLELGRSLRTAERTGSGVLATFADSGTAEGEVLIGADGVHSTVRGLVDPAAPEPRFCGTHIRYGYTPRTVQAPPAPEAFRIFWGRNATFGYTSATGDYYWFAGIPAREPLPTTAAAELEGSRQWLLGLFRRDRTPATAIIRDAEVILATNPRAVPGLSSWHNGSMVVIGDAAHAVPPATEQGAALAIEDAVVLAQSLRDAGDTGQALSAFEAARRERVERVAARGAGQTARLRARTGWLARRKRDRAMAEAVRGGALAPPAWLHDFHLDWEERTSGTGD
ncbi:FAD-dependent oxidoreductase [Amycolatopsis aidingensis]|uniref:FAD-dependent oxidoreductase n=1 Tax=Amycolatopsis aidingensis TaxID=2842453 RepID=UPI001C0DB7E2|nr:FAD-dependent oxidoreductase [Amycolatopsis aidingensis]